MLFCFFFFKQKTAYEMRISDWSSDVCSSDLAKIARGVGAAEADALDVGLVTRHGPLARRQPGNRDGTGLDFGQHRRRCNAKRQIGRASCRERVCQYV